MSRFEEDFKGANDFLEPILRPTKPSSTNGEISLAKVLLPRCTDSNNANEFTDQARVAIQALNYLKVINDKLEKLLLSTEEIDEAFQTPWKRRIMNTLIDIVSIEGIHPYLDFGVGIPLPQRVQATFKQWEISPQSSVPSIKWGRGAWEIYRGLMSLRSRTMLSSLIDDRIMVDLVAFMLQAAYSPSIGSSEVRGTLRTLCDSVETIRLMPLIASLIHKDAPEWLKVAASGIIARMPLRNNGVRDTINFIARSQIRRGHPTDEHDRLSSSGPLISNEVLEQAAQVISTVPESSEPELWFRIIGSQLLKMLWSDDLVDHRSASYIAGTILSRRNVGSPWTPGWKWLSIPLLSHINPDQSLETDETCSKILEDVLPTDQVRWAVTCLARLLLQNPNPGLVQRLVSRTITSLWGIACLSREGRKLEDIFENCISIIRKYYSITNHCAVEKLTDKFFFEGTHKWHFEIRDECILILRKQPKEPSDDLFTSLIQDLEKRTSTFLEIIDGFPNDKICEVFVSILKKWTSKESTQERDSIIGVHDENDPSQIVCAKIVFAMLQKYQAILAKRPQKLLPAVIFVIENYLTEIKTRNETKNSPSRVSLSDIVKLRDMSGESEDDTLPLVNAAIGILTAISLELPVAGSSSKDFDLNMANLRRVLSCLVRESGVPHEVLLSIQTILTQLDVKENATKPTLEREIDLSKNRLNGQFVAYQNALISIGSELAPVRAEGLEALNDLISRRSPVALVPSTMNILLALLADNDEYVYLAAIKSMCLLVAIKPGSFFSQLIEAYLDHRETSTMEVRLRLGEVVERIIGEIGPSIDTSTAQKIALSMLALAGRRGTRAREQTQRLDQFKQAALDQRRAEREWGGEVPELPDELREDVTPADEAAARIIENWAGKNQEEDSRIRASGLAVLDTLLSTAARKLTIAVTENVIKFCASALQLESDESGTILRRGAVLVLRGLVAGIENSEKDGLDKDKAISVIWMQQIVEILTRLNNVETDPIIKEHVREVLRAIEESVSDEINTMLQGENIEFDLGDRLHGLAIQTDKSSGRRPKIEEIG